MTKQRLLIGGMAAILMAGTSLLADDHDKQTTLTVNETVSVPGKVLGPGKYVMQLNDSSTDRNIVQIYTEDKILVATIMAIPNRRTTRPDKTVLTYWETPSGQPPALRAWFFPGDFVGQEFVYPKGQALQLSSYNGNANVPSHDGPDQPAADTFARLTLHDLGQTQPTPTVAATPAVAPTPIPQVAALPAPAPQPGVLLAQSTPQTVVTPNLSSDALSTSTSTPPDIDELPRTASPIPAIAFAGLLMVAFAGFSRLLRA
ncbi:MAG: hypothetical protein ABI824_04865 [Acidobacteriota bacterium]